MYLDYGKNLLDSSQSATFFFFPFTQLIDLQIIYPFSMLLKIELHPSFHISISKDNSPRLSICVQQKHTV